MGPCVVCKTLTKKRCSNCALLFYCSIDHQKQDWKLHKLNCHPFKVIKNTKLGRCLITTRNIRQYEIILKETPIVRTPSQNTVPVCLGCLNNIQKNQSIECENCGWPVCDNNCKDSIEHKAECILIQKNNFKPRILGDDSHHRFYQSIGPIRCLSLKNSNKRNWEDLMDLESLEELRKGTQQWKTDHNYVKELMGSFVNTSEFNENNIMKILGIIQTNGHEVPTTNPSHVAIYKKASLLEHSCVPNLAKSFTSNGGIILWAPKDIKKKTNLSICYSDAIWCTSTRQEHLWQTKLFKCDCPRCADVTEFGTNYGALKCFTEDCNGFCFPTNLDHWQCNKCLKSPLTSKILDILHQAFEDSQILLNNDCRHIQFLEKYINFLAPQHFYLSETKLQLIQLIGNDPQKLKQESDERLCMKVNYAKDLIRLYEILAPCEVRLMGILYFELHSAIMETARRVFVLKKLNNKLLLKQSLEAVEACIAYLQYEPEILMEGQILKQAKLNRDMLRMISL